MKQPLPLLITISLCAALAACVPVALAPAPPASPPAAEHSSPPPASPSPKAPVKAQSAYADEVDLSAFARLHCLTAAVGDAFPGEFDVVVWCEDEMFDFLVSTVAYDGEQFYEVEALGSVAYVAPGEAVTFAAWIPESIPGTKVSYLTADGQRLEHLLAWSGLDGSVHLIAV